MGPRNRIGGTEKREETMGGIVEKYKTGWARKDAAVGQWMFKGQRLRVNGGQRSESKRAQVRWTEKEERSHQIGQVSSRKNRMCFLKGRKGVGTGMGPGETPRNFPADPTENGVRAPRMRDIWTRSRMAMGQIAKETPSLYINESPLTNLGQVKDSTQENFEF